MQWFEIVLAVLAVLVPLGVGWGVSEWSNFKASAAKTESKLDDLLVSFVELTEAAVKGSKQDKADDQPSAE